MRIIVVLLFTLYVELIYCANNSSVACDIKSKCAIENTQLTGSCVSRTSGCCSGSFSDSYCPGSSDVQCCMGVVNKSTVGISELISRANVKIRAQDWVNRKIPYSQIELTDGYRQDCSGLVSMAWNSTMYDGGHSTYDLEEICHRITKEELQSGDIMLLANFHTLIFDQWIDDDLFWEYAEHDYGQVASYDQNSYQKLVDLDMFPCRYNLIV